MEAIVDALRYISPDDYDTWLRVGLALKLELGEGGLALWRDWSARSPKYQEREVERKWRTMRPHGDVTLGTIYYLAGQAGWQRQVDRDARPPKADRVVAAASRRATEVWRRARAATSHPYLDRKGVTPTETLRVMGADELAQIAGYHPQVDGSPLRGLVLIVPLGHDGKLVTIEMIDEDGTKCAYAHLPKSGAYWAPAALPGHGTVLVAEGVATALSLHAAGYVVVAATCAANQRHVAERLRDRGYDVVLAADLDRTTGAPYGPTVRHAQELAVRVIAPQFPEQREPWQTDYNDLHAACGIEVVSDQVRSALETAHVAWQLPSMPERPCYRLLEHDVQVGAETYRAGVWHFGLRHSRDGAVHGSATWVCSPVRVIAVTREMPHDRWGRLLQVRTPNGEWRDVVIQMEHLAGTGEAYRATLLAAGAEIGHRDRLSEYVSQSSLPIATTAAQIGWHEDTFVLPDTSMGSSIRYTGVPIHGYTTGGSLDGWRTGVARYAEKNPLLCLVLSAAFAGPLIYPCRAEGGGIHLVGDSSTGKSTALDAAASVWGDVRTLRRSWRATANGLEGAAAASNDAALILDEIGECRPDEIGAIIYGVANGVGKQRASRSGASRPVLRWRTIILSSGERGIQTAIEAGHGQARAGQHVRLLDIPADARHGIYHDLCGHPDGAQLSDAIRIAAARHYGHPSREYLTRLAADLQQDVDLEARYNTIRARFEVSTGQQARAASRLALFALAGELASSYGITGWAAGTAIDACLACYDAWRQHYGSAPREEAQVIAAIRDAIDRHGDARFSPLGAHVAVRDRMGWYDDTPEGRVYYFTAQGLREALRGHDARRAMTRLRDQYILLGSRNVRVTDGDVSRVAWVHIIRYPDVGDRE